MANHKSAVKKHNRDEKLRLINKANRTKYRNKIKLFRKKIDENNLEEAKELLPKVNSMIDKTVSKGTIHKKTGSRYKSRISLLLKNSGT